MALSGSKTVAVTSYDSLKFSWEETSIVVDDNYSNVSWKLQLISTAYGAISSSASKEYLVTINGTKFEGTNTIGIGNNATKTLASGSLKIYHNTDGSKTFSYSFMQEFAITFSGTYYGVKSGSGSGTLTNIARGASIDSAPNFDDEDNPTITYHNPAGSAVDTLEACISLTGAKDDIAYRNISKTGTSYTFNLTEAERNILRSAAANSNSISVRFYISTTIGDRVYRKYLTKTLSIVNANPTLAPTAIDTGSYSTTLTDGANWIIKGYNSVQVAANAAALKGASIKSYKISCGDKSITTATGKLNNVDSNIVKFTVTDSRGNSTTKTVTLRLISYVFPTCNLTVSTPTTSGDLSLTVKGNYFNGSFGAVDNALTVQYRYKVNDGSYGAWTALSPTITGNTYAVTENITGLDYQSNYTFQARALDVINNGTNSPVVLSVERKVKALPIFDWGESDFQFNVAVNFPNNNRLNGTTTDGTILNAFQPCNGNNNLVIGYGAYTDSIGATNLYGNDVNILTNTDLTVNDGEDVYSILGAMRAMTTVYELECTVTDGANYSGGSATAFLIGNNLRMYISADRNSNANVGDVSNETVMTIKVKHDGKIKSLYGTAFASATTGAPATFHATAQKLDDNNHTVTINLCGVAVADNGWSGYWCLPCTLNLSKYV